MGLYINIYSNKTGSIAPDKETPESLSCIKSCGNCVPHFNHPLSPNRHWLPWVLVEHAHIYIYIFYSSNETTDDGKMLLYGDDDVHGPSPRDARTEHACR